MGSLLGIRGPSLPASPSKTKEGVGVDAVNRGNKEVTYDRSNGRPSAPRQVT